MPWLATLSVSAAIRLLIGLLLASVLLRLAFQGIQTFNIQAIGQRLTARIRDDLFSHSLSLSLRFHDGMPVGKLLTDSPVMLTRWLRCSAAVPLVFWVISSACW